MNWIVPRPLQNAYVGALCPHPKVTILGDRAFKEVIKVKWDHVGWDLDPVGLTSLQEELETPGKHTKKRRAHVMYGRREKAAIYKPQGLSPETNSPALTSDLPLLELRKSLSVAKAPQPVMLGYGTWADQENVLPAWMAFCSLTIWSPSYRRLNLVFRNWVVKTAISSQKLCLYKYTCTLWFLIRPKFKAF